VVEMAEIEAAASKARMTRMDIPSRGEPHGY
jgi:hypothetical protein